MGNSFEDEAFFFLERSLLGAGKSRMGQIQFWVPEEAFL